MIQLYAVYKRFTLNPKAWGKIKEWVKIYHANVNQKRTGVAKLISRKKLSKKILPERYFMIQGSIPLGRYDYYKHIYS